MTIDEVIGPVMVPVAYGLAVSAVILLFWHVRGRYPSAPKRVPLGLGMDGRPRTVGAKRWLWLAPAVIAAVLALLGVFLVTAPPTADQRTPIALVFVTLAEVAWFVAWSTDRQIEIARGMTYRIAPLRTLRVFAPILATIVVTIVLAIRP